MWNELSAKNFNSSKVMNFELVHIFTLNKYLYNHIGIYGHFLKTTIMRNILDKTSVVIYEYI